MQVDPTLASSVNSLKKDIFEIIESGQYYVTPEIANEFAAIHNALEHLRLDSNFLTTSSEWTDKWGPDLTSGASRAAAEVLLKCGGFMYDYKNRMLINRLRGQQENQIRTDHHWAMQNLVAFQNELDQFTNLAADRIRQFGDHVGVTDRYTGYRNNLTRGSRQPFRMATNWMDKTSPQGYMNGLGYRPSTAVNVSGQQTNNFTSQRARSAALGTRVSFGEFGPAQRDTRGYQTIDTLYPRSNPVFGTREPYSSKIQELKSQNYLNAIQQKTAQSPDVSMSTTGLRNLSVQEQAGINTTFPGRTEYMHKYERPEMDIKTSDFNINPTPDFLLHKRPLGQTTYEPSNTEYQVRYEWPDSEKIVRLPWLRK